MINSGQLAKRQKNHRAIENKNTFSKQTHVKKKADTFVPLTKKLKEVD